MIERVEPEAERVVTRVEVLGLRTNTVRPSGLYAVVVVLPSWSTRAITRPSWS